MSLQILWYSDMNILGNEKMQDGPFWYNQSDYPFHWSKWCI